MRYLYFFIASGIIWLVMPASAQDGDALERFTPVNGSVASGEMQRWTFTATEGEVLSFVVEAVSDNFDPVLTITTSTGGLLIANDDYAYPDTQDSILEAITIPRRDTYTVTVSGFGKSSGDYTLTMLAGFAQLVASDRLDDRRLWQSSGNPLIMEIDSGQMNLSLAGVQKQGVAASSAEIPTNAYINGRVLAVRGDGGWVAGMIARHQTNNSYYALEINNRGEWRFLVRDSTGERVLRSWITHPAIVADQTNFTLGMMVNGTGFDFFYNDLLIGRQSDNTLTEAGRAGFIVETGTAANSQTNAQFDDLTVTAPLQVDNGYIIPDRLIVANSTTMAQELQRRHLIPSNGEMILTVPESFVTSNQPGVNEILLGGGQRFQNFALGTTVSWETQGTGQTGCGLLVRAASDTDYTLVYLDQTGGHGISRRQGDTFEPGLFAEKPYFTGTTHHLLVIADENLLRYYVDGQYAGGVEDAAREGLIGNAVVSFEPIITSCQFTDTWLWRWS